MGTVLGGGCFAVGVDLGGTKTEAVLLSPGGDALWRKRQATPLVQGYQAVLAGVVELVAEAAAAGGGADYTVGIAINGTVREGAHRIAGEWGHFSVLPDGPLCYCGNRGCVETLISGSGVERGFFASYGQLLTMQEIVAQARQGEPRCQATFHKFLDDFGRCLGGLISILDPDAVVLGGGLSNIEKLYGAGLERVRQYAFHDNLQTPLLKNRLGDSAGMIGAAWIGRQTP